jgi:outer membrane protein OmpA-like peptidoglycan-associated protein
MKKFATIFTTLVLALSGLAISPASTAELMQATPSGLTPRLAAGNPAVFEDGIQNTTPNAHFKSVSCPSAGNCVAAGRFTNAAGYYEAFTQTQTNGNWAKSEPAVFETGVQSTNPEAIFNSVSCFAAGNCVAVGRFKNAGGGNEAFSITQTNGEWAKSKPATFDSGMQATNPDDEFVSVSCSPTGNCVAVGSFESMVSGETQAFTQSQTNGIWAKSKMTIFDPGVEAAAPDRHNSYFISVACSSGTNCVATGKFTRPSGSWAAFTQTQTNGNWEVSDPAIFDAGIENIANPSSAFNSVSCSSVGNCVAVGNYENIAGDGEPFTQTQTNGTWADSEPATFGEGDQSSTPYGAFDSVSCYTPGDCVAVGFIENLAGGLEAVTQTQNNGYWANLEPATFEPGFQGSDRYGQFDSVSCYAAGDCVAAGYFKNAAGGYQAFTQTLTNGVWAQSIPATFNPGVQSDNPNDAFFSISCPSAENCVAVGKFKNATGGTEAFTQNITEAVAPSPTELKLASLTKLVKFETSSTILTPSQKSILKKIVAKSGKKATFTITGTAGKLPGVTDSKVKALAKKRAQIVQAYLVKLGVKKSHITIKVKITNQGIVPKTKILAKYLNK